ncbi:MAG: hypothetical protein IJN59_04640, partial [Oscillospiraceae bacterium]|nr:hypothetical protein [Oscillospiraceae bacterium]
PHFNSIQAITAALCTYERTYRQLPYFSIYNEKAPFGEGAFSGKVYFIKRREKLFKSICKVCFALQL